MTTEASAGAERRTMWAARSLVQPSAPPRRRLREPPPDRAGPRLKLYYLAEHIDDQRQVAWHDSRQWNRRGMWLAASSAVGSAIGAAGVALGGEIPNFGRYAIVIIALIAAGLGAAAAAVGAPEKAASQQQRFVELDSLSRFADYVELIEMPNMSSSVQRGEEFIRLIEVRLDEINNAPKREWFAPSSQEQEAERGAS